MGKERHQQRPVVKQHRCWNDFSKTLKQAMIKILQQIIIKSLEANGKATCFSKEIEDMKEKPNGNFQTGKHSDQNKSEFNSRTEETEARITEPENRIIETFPSEEEREYRMKTKHKKETKPQEPMECLQKNLPSCPWSHGKKGKEGRSEKST
jgi:hypothetical protein